MIMIFPNSIKFVYLEFQMKTFYFHNILILAKVIFFLLSGSFSHFQIYILFILLNIALRDFNKKIITIINNKNNNNLNKKIIKFRLKILFNNMK